jgi:hypothetical protein
VGTQSVRPFKPADGLRMLRRNHQVAINRGSTREHVAIHSAEPQDDIQHTVEGRLREGLSWGLGEGNRKDLAGNRDDSGGIEGIQPGLSDLRQMLHATLRRI